MFCAFNFSTELLTFSISIKKTISKGEMVFENYLFIGFTNYMSFYYRNE
jgi:hypothetical protein